MYNINFKVNDRFVVSLVQSKTSEPAVAEIPNPDGLSDRIDIRIIELIRRDPSILAKQMSESTGVTVRTIRRHLSSLTEKGYISRAGTTREGRFLILYDMANDSSDTD